MEKKIYEAPELEVMDMEVEGFFCQSGDDYTDIPPQI